MKKYAVMDIQENRPIRMYQSNYMKIDRTYADPSKYAHYEVADGEDYRAYTWNGTSVVLDPSWITPQSNLNEVVKGIVKNAIIFGQEIIIEFAASNVAMGITQAGKTKDTADYLQDLDRYVRSGSLYGAVAEIDRLILTGLPVELSPFITESRLNEFKLKIVQYLS